jgi:hypothetical protein
VVSLEIAKCTDEWVDWKPIAERAEGVIDMIERGVIQ